MKISAEIHNTELAPQDHPKSMANQLVISVMTRDRVGIVADVTTAIKDLDGNLADLSQTVLCGYFTMIVIASFPEHVTLAAIREALYALDREDPLEIGIKVPSTPLVPEPSHYSTDHFVLTAIGPDKIGLVAAVSSYLRDKTINIDDLTTRVEEGQYAMILSIDLPGHADIGDFRADMQQALKPYGVNVDIQHHDIFRAMNEV